MNKIFFKTNSGFVDYIRRDGFTVNMVNPLFSDENFKFWSYPYEDYMTDEFKREFQNLSLLNRSNFKSKEEGQLNLEGAVYDATLEIINTDTNLVKKQIDFGYKKLNYTDFKINELNYGEINVADIYDYVDSVLDKTYPEINHCFPRLQTNEFEQENNGVKENICPFINDTYLGKVKRISSQVDFVKIQNLLKPHIFLLEILKRSFESLGYRIEGDILNDDDFRFLALDNDGISYTEEKYEVKNFKIPLQKSFGVTETRVTTEKLNIIGKYIFNVFYQGNFSSSQQKPWRPVADIKIEVKYNGEVKTFEITSASGVLDELVEGSGYLIYTLNLPFFSKWTEVEIVSTIKVVWRTGALDGQTHALSFFFNPLYTNDVKQGDTLFIMKNKLELNQFVPDISLSSVLEFLKKYGYKAIPKGNAVYFNKAYLTNSPAKDFRFSEIEFPEIIPQSFPAKIIKLSSYDKLKYGKITITKEGILLNSEKKFINPEEITINALPLPLIDYSITRKIYDTNGNLSLVTENLKPVKKEVDTGTEIRLIKYRGVFDKKNDGLDISHLLPENAINTYFKNEIKFFHSDNIKWTFTSSSEEFKNLKEDDIIFAYKRELVIKEFSKTYIGENMYQIEFNTLSIL